MGNQKDPDRTRNKQKDRLPTKEINMKCAHHLMECIARKIANIPGRHRYGIDKELSDAVRARLVRIEECHLEAKEDTGGASLTPEQRSRVVGWPENDVGEESESDEEEDCAFSASSEDGSSSESEIEVADEDADAEVTNVDDDRNAHPPTKRFRPSPDESKHTAQRQLTASQVTPNRTPLKMTLVKDANGGCTLKYHSILLPDSLSNVPSTYRETPMNTTSKNHSKKAKLESTSPYRTASTSTAKNSSKTARSKVANCSPKSEVVSNPHAYDPRLEAMPITLTMRKGPNAMHKTAADSKANSHLTTTESNGRTSDNPNQKSSASRVDPYTCSPGSVTVSTFGTRSTLKPTNSKVGSSPCPGSSSTVEDVAPLSSSKENRPHSRKENRAHLGTKPASDAPLKVSNDCYGLLDALEKVQASGTLAAPAIESSRRFSDSGNFKGSGALPLNPESHRHKDSGACATSCASSRAIDSSRKSNDSTNTKAGVFPLNPESSSHKRKRTTSSMSSGAREAQAGTSKSCSGTRRSFESGAAAMTHASSRAIESSRTYHHSGNFKAGILPPNPASYSHRRKSSTSSVSSGAQQVQSESLMSGRLGDMEASWLSAPAPATASTSSGHGQASRTPAPSTSSAARPTSSAARQSKSAPSNSSAPRQSNSALGPYKSAPTPPRSRFAAKPTSYDAGPSTSTQRPLNPSPRPSTSTPRPPNPTPGASNSTHRSPNSAQRPPSSVQRPPNPTAGSSNSTQRSPNSAQRPPNPTAGSSNSTQRPPNRTPRPSTSTQRPPNPTAGSSNAAQLPPICTQEFQSSHLPLPTSRVRHDSDTSTCSSGSDTSLDTDEADELVVVMRKSY